MDIINLIPLIVVGGAFQLSVQIYYLIHCVNNNRLDNKQKSKWAIIIVLFHVIGVILYLFYTRKTAVSPPSINLIESLDKNIVHLVFLFILYSYEILAFVSAFQSKDEFIAFIFLAVVFLLLIIRHCFVSSGQKVLYYLLPIVELVLILSANYIALSRNYLFLILFVVASLLNEYPLKYAKYIITAPLIIYLSTGVIKLNTIFIENGKVLTSDDITSFVMENLIIYVMVVAVFYIAKRQLIMNENLQLLMKELKEKNQKLEEISIIKERNRIAREIHDTLGHTLTGAIIQLEAAKKLVSVDSQKAIEAIEQTQTTTRTGFAELKRAIKALKPILLEDNTLKDALLLLFERIQNESDYKINSRIEISDTIDKNIKECIYKITQELITNSIRHGKATSMDITITQGEDLIRLQVEDNGIGCNQIVEGYGLKGIRERIAVYNGKVHYSSKENQGFAATIEL